MSRIAMVFSCLFWTVAAVLMYQADRAWGVGMFVLAALFLFAFAFDADN